jgi:hypothetical protein
VSLGDQTRGQTRTHVASLQRQSILVSLVAGAAVFVGTVTQSPAPRFVYDAVQYWAGSVSLLNGGDAYVDGGLSLRGVFTSVLYLPAALATKVFGHSASGMAVLVENSLLVALIGALLLPRLLRVWGPVTPWMVLVCAGLTWLVVGRFAPYPLTDLWAGALMLAALVALERRTAMGLMGAGLIVGITFNVRPAYLVLLLLTPVVVLFRDKIRVVWFAAGVVVALVPQSIVNLRQGTGWKPWPPALGQLMQLRSTGSYAVRYDTAAYGVVRDPQQYFCDPAMARVVVDHPPLSSGDLTALYLHHVPQWFVLVVERATAVMHWPLSAPYFAPAGARDNFFAFLVTTVVVVGVVTLVSAQFRSAFRSVPAAAWVALLVGLGSLSTIVTSNPETRLALPLVLFGIAGCAVLVGRRLGRRWAAGAAVAVVVVFAVGTLGLSHAAAPGPASPSVCAASAS